MRALSRNIKAAIIAVLIIAVAGVAASAYMYTQSQSKPASATVKLTILVATGDPTLMPFIQMVAQDFMSKYPNIVIEIQPVPFAQLVTTAQTALQNKNPDPSIIIFYPSQAPALGPYLLDLRKYFDSGLFNKSDIPESSLLPVYMLAPNGSIIKVFGVPFQQVFGYALVYRKSIFENKTLQEEFKQKYGFDFDPKTWDSWDQLIKAAEFIQSKNITKYALLFPNGLQMSIFNGFIGIFYTYALKMNDTCPDIPIKDGVLPPLGYWLYIKELPDGSFVPTFTCPSFVEALKRYKQLVQFQPPIDVQAMEYDQLRDLFQTGDYAMVAAWTSFIPVYNNPNTSRVAGDIDIAPLPGGRFPFYTGQAPTFIGINPYARDVDAAAKFIAFLLTPEVMRKGAEKYGFIPATFSGLYEASKVPSTSWVRLFIPILQETSITDIKRLTTVNYITNFFTDLRPIFINEVAKYLRGQQTAEETAQRIAQQWLTVMKISK